MSRFPILFWLLPLCLSLMPLRATAKLCLDYATYPESDPALPWGGTIFTEAILDLDVMAGHAYLVTEGGNLRIVELSTPQLPFEVANFALGPGPAERIAVLGCQAYTGRRARLQVIDITSAYTPLLIGGWALDAEILGLEAAHNLLAVTLADSTLRLFHAPDCDDPLEAASLATEQAYASLAVAPGRVMLGGAGEIAFVDAGDPWAPVALGKTPVPGTVRDLCVWGDTLAAITANRLLLLDLTAGGIAPVLDEKALAGEARALSAKDRQLHITAAGGGWWVYSPDHQEMRQPVGWGLLPEPGMAVVIEGPAVFFAAGAGGLQVAWPQCPIDPPTTVLEAPGRLQPYLEVFPNPGNPLFHIRFEHFESGPVRLRILDLAGRLVEQVETGSRSTRSCTITWDGRDRTGRPVASGSYAVVAETPTTRATTTLVLLR